MTTITNHGVLEGRRPTDWVHERVGALPYEVRNPSGNWTNYLPSAERQTSRTAETMACVSYSIINVIEAQIKFLTGTELNFSDRWLAKMSNTTTEGNYLWVVADTVRKFGLVTQSEWPEPPNYTWDSYYAPIAPAIQSKGKEFLANWSIAYEWIEVSKESLLKHLKHAPLQVVLPGHVVMSFFQVADVTKYFDTYEPFIKSANVNKFTDALKVIVTPKKRMSQLVTQQKGPELRIVAKCATIEEYNALCKVYGLNPQQIDEKV